MKINSFLERADVTAAVPIGSKEEILSSLVDLLVSNHQELKRDLLLQVLLKREQLRSTAIEEGVAFPHGRVPGLPKLISCFGRCRKGVDFDSFDGKPTRFFFVLLIPENAEGTHLKALARLNRLFQDEHFRHTLLEAEDADSVFDAILAQDASC
ncbi:MAG: PTS sugar transporter subunit IIA [Deltaproteobacteria bacterium]|nr:PTS sugar transporter subunit IIA [Deltaproteobacteria bacterium]